MIEVLKQALEALEDVGVLTDREWQAVHKNKANELRQAIAELESQEPVAVWELFEDGWDSIADPEWMESLPIGTKLYTHPQPKRKPLTDEQVEKIIKANMSLQMNLAGIRQDFEAAHGIKE
jgi:hypothetical protein